MAAYDGTYKRRRALLDAARNLARSGQHTDCSTIIAQITAAEDFALVRKWFEDRALRAQLDRLCAVARRGPTNSTGRGHDNGQP